MWSWCGQVSSATEDYIDHYLALMTELEEDFPSITFIYMTGHTDGSGLNGTLHTRNEQIRQYVKENNKVLFDFEDIESYDPDGTYFGDKNVTDSCGYEGGNWALEWQEANPDDWYSCPSAHSQALNANMKAYAAWWLFARIAGWVDTASSETSSSSSSESTTSSVTSSSSSSETGTSDTNSSNDLFAPISIIPVLFAGVLIPIITKYKKHYEK